MKVLLVIYLIIAGIWFLLSDTFTVKMTKKKGGKVNIATHIALIFISLLFPIFFLKLIIDRITDRIIEDMEGKDERN